MRFEIERLGVGRFSLSSGPPPSDVRELFFFSPGDEEGRWVMLIALDARRTFFAGFGDPGMMGEVAACDGRREMFAVCRFGVAGVEESGEFVALGDFVFETLLTLSVACAWSMFSVDCARSASLLTSIPNMRNLWHYAVSSHCW